MISDKEKDIIIETLRPYRPQKIGVFGSRAHGKHTKDSDLDLLVAFPHINMLELVELEDKLSQLLDVNVDLVTEASISRYLRPHIEDEVYYFFESDEVANEE